MWILIRWLHQKPADLDLQCFQNRIPGSAEQWIHEQRQCGMCDEQRLRPACAYAQSDLSLCLSLVYSMTVKLLTEHHLEFLCLKEGCTGPSESSLVKMPHCWKSHVAALYIDRYLSHTWLYACAATLGSRSLVDGMLIFNVPANNFQ